MNKIVFYVVLFSLLSVGNVLAQSKDGATLVFNNGTEMYGAVNIEPGKSFKCEISFIQKSTVTEKSKGRFSKKTSSYETKFSVSTIKYIIMNFTEYYPKSVYDNVTNETTCYLTKRPYGKGIPALYQFKNNAGVTSHFFEDAMFGRLHSIEDTVFTGKNNDKELANLFLQCNEFSTKFKNKETGYFLTSSMKPEQKLEAFKKWINEYNNCPK
ncbi:MAG: hypothetical protein KA160_08290 [Lacibacter sp.]|nr:hypothetical protein [Lacibacter sp.]